MNDIIVSVRMPKGLTEELRALTKRDHFMDISETVRSIMRQKYIKASGGLEGGDKGALLSKLKKLMEELNESR
jgi:metal-responsive CopG/Arc/MetJ family transcriptional regulator